MIGKGENLPTTRLPKGRVTETSPAMYHTIEFDEPLTLDVEVSRKEPLHRLSVRKGTRVRAQIRPHVIEAEDGPVEVADLFFEDGRATRQVRYASFCFID